MVFQQRVRQGFMQNGLCNFILPRLCTYNMAICLLDPLTPASTPAPAAALRSRGGTSRSVTTVCNQTRIRGVLGDVVARAEEKFKARAYLHW